MIGARQMNVHFQCRALNFQGAGEGIQAGRLFNSKAERHGPDARATTGEGAPLRFYQTKPFVMLKKLHLYYSERMGCADYRKMTNGFVFLFSAFTGRVCESEEPVEVHAEDPVFFLCSRWSAAYNSLTT